MTTAAAVAVAAQGGGMVPFTPLVVSADQVLVSDVRRLAAAAGVPLDVVADPVAALPLWSVAPVVLVGGDLAGPLAAARPPRRGRVHVVAHEPVADGLFREAMTLAASSVTGLPASDDWLVELLTDLGDGVTAPALVIGVIGGAGGAGATVFATALAQAAAVHAGETLLVDADPLGAGIDKVLGLEGRDGVHWDDLMQTTGRLSSRSLRESLPRSDDLAVLTWPPGGTGALQPFAVREVLSAGRRGFDVLVLDLPRHRDAVVEETLSRCDHALLVSTLTVPGVTAAARVARSLPESSRGLVTRGGHGGVTPEAASKLLGVPLLASMRDQRGLDESVDLGAGPARSPRGVLARTAREVIAQLAPERGPVAA